MSLILHITFLLFFIIFIIVVIIIICLEKFVIVVDVTFTYLEFCRVGDVREDGRGCLVTVLGGCKPCWR